VEIPAELRYSREHEWMRTGGETVRVGITDYAQDQLGDVVFVELPDVGAELEPGTVMAEIESTKSVGEVYAPFRARVAAVNESVVEHPELVNQDPYGEGWLVDLEALDGTDGDFLDAEGYRTLVE
jgi:glycine cleavage system H protein